MGRAAMDNLLLDLLRSAVEKESVNRFVVSFTPIANPSRLPSGDARKLLHPVSGWVSIAYDEHVQYAAVLLQRARQRGKEFVLVQVSEDEHVAHSVWRRNAPGRWHLLRGSPLPIIDGGG